VWFIKNYKTITSFYFRGFYYVVEYEKYSILNDALQIIEMLTVILRKSTEIVFMIVSGPTMEKVTERRRKCNNICNYISIKSWIVRGG